MHTNVYIPRHVHIDTDTHGHAQSASVGTTKLFNAG